MGEMYNKITLKFQFEEQDILHLYKVNFKKILRLPIIFYILPLLFIFMILLNIQQASDSVTSSNNTGSGISLLQPILLGVIIIIVVFVTPLLIRRTVRNNFKNNKALQNMLEYTISDDKISCHTDTSDDDYDWSSFNKIVETKLGFILYRSNSNVILLPKRSFADMNDITVVRNILTGNFQGKKYKVEK